MLQFRLTYLICCMFHYLPRLDTTVFRCACIPQITDTQTLVQLMAKSHNSTYLSFFCFFLYLRIVTWTHNQAVPCRLSPCSLWDCKCSPVSLRFMFLNTLLEHSHFTQVPASKLCFVYFFYLNRSKKKYYICRYFDWNEIKKIQTIRLSTRVWQLLSIKKNPW